MAVAGSAGSLRLRVRLGDRRAGTSTRILESPRANAAEATATLASAGGDAGGAVLDLVGAGPCTAGAVACAGEEHGQRSGAEAGLGAGTALALAAEWRSSADRVSLSGPATVSW